MKVQRSEAPLLMALIDKVVVKQIKDISFPINKNTKLLLLNDHNLDV